MFVVMKMEEKQTRTNKYKDLREATQENQEELPVVEETAEEEDDFLSFIPKSKDAEVDESMLNPLSYETLEVDENVKSALNRVKENIGKDDFSTRMDILNRLKADHHAASINVDEEDLSEGKDVSSSPMSVQETLTEMSQEEEKEEEPVIPVIVEEETTQLSKKEIKALKKQEKETAKQEKEEEKAAKRQKIEEEKTAKRQKAEEEKALKKHEKEAKKQEKVEKKQTKEVERQQSKKKNDDKKAHPVLDFFLNLIIVLLFLAVLMFIVYTILVQMKIV